MTLVEKLYLDTLKNTLIDLHRCKGYDHKTIVNWGPFHFTRATKIDQQKRINGEDWPASAESMIGLKRMDNIQELIQRIIENKVPGDFLEAGVWRGGASIFIKANLIVHKSDKELFVCDSFKGLPAPTKAEDAGDDHYRHPYLAVSKFEVMLNFLRYGLVDIGGDVIFVEGWFKETMPTLKHRQFSLIRLDGDMYESTMDVLQNIYPLLSPGGFIIIDDYCLTSCRSAVLQFRSDNDIYEPMIPIDPIAVYWQKITPYI